MQLQRQSSIFCKLASDKPMTLHEKWKMTLIDEDRWKRGLTVLDVQMKRRGKMKGIHEKK